MRVLDNQLQLTSDPARISYPETSELVQWPAVTTVFLLIRVPPQNWKLFDNRATM